MKIKLPGQNTFYFHSYQVNDIVAIKSLGNTANDPIIPVGANYILANAVLTHIASATYIGSSYGLTTPTATAAFAVGSDKTLTFSLTDFNNLRIKTADALLTVGNKIDEILNVANLSCGLAFNNLS